MEIELPSVPDDSWGFHFGESSMTDSSARKQRGERNSTSSILLLTGQFLIIAGILLIVSTNDLRSLWAGSDSVLDKLDQLTFSIAELQGDPQASPPHANSGWTTHYLTYQRDLEDVLRQSAGFPGLRDRVLQVDEIVKRMAGTRSKLEQQQSIPSDSVHLYSQLRADELAAISGVVNARRIVRSRVSSAHNGIATTVTSLKVLLLGACLVGFGMVLVFRKSRVDLARQKALQRELRNTNEEVATALDAARDGIDARNQFLYSFGEGLQKSLDQIIGHTTMLLETDLSGAQQEHANKNLSVAQSIAAAISDVLDYSDLDAAKLALRDGEFDPAALLRDVVGNFQSRAHETGIRLRARIAEDLPALIRGDGTRVRQVLDNLVDNALKFTDRGEILVCVAEAGSSSGRVTLRFEVKDTGIGMGEQARSRLFEPFVHSGDLVNRGDGSTGLGLAISKKLVELMGGAIDVTSEPGRGSSFRFTISCECPSANAQSPDPSLCRLASHVNAPAQQGSGRDRRIASRQRINHPTLLKSKVAGMAVVRVLDVSTTGMRVSVPFRLPLNTEVEIRIDDHTISGLVRNCVCKAATEFHIGVEVLEPEAVGGRSFDQVLRRVHA